ncbi:hypothetical protein C2E23DRAFT_882030 [Lenzites betulinus]|nr:hypothetical protein C2E23DRAFT_882030 [Lenzites betulinus]
MARNNNPTSTAAVDTVRRHPKYYLNGGDFYVLVDNYVFRVHRYFFERESQWFRENLSAETPSDQAPTSNGTSEAKPFVLNGIAPEDFSKFLWVFYNPKYTLYDATLDDWTVILKLAFSWRFEEVKRLCTRELEKFELPPVQKIELYQTYELERDLLIPSLQALCARQEPLTLDEGRAIGLETTLLLAAARECARGELLANGSRSPTIANLGVDDMMSIIRQTFRLGPLPPDIS